MEEEAYHEPDASQLEALANFMPDFEVVEHAESEDELNADGSDGDKAHQEADAEALVENAQEFTYRLFSNVSTTKLEASRADSATDLDEHGDVRYIHVEQKRPMSYYFQESRLEELRHCVSVIDGETVLRLSHQPWPGCAAPDRVLHLRQPDTVSKTKKRWRPSKARRDRFKILKVQEEQKERQRAASRAGQRGRGGRGHGSSRGGRSRGRGS